MRRLEADYLDGVLRPTRPLQLKQGERVGLVVMRRSDQKRWDLERLTRTSQEDEALAGAGLNEWARALEDEDRR
jgi:predicted DNA-binding antitoxin AbrB/MazE fold protein